MKRVDQIIKYLSGELTQEEASFLEMKLEKSSEWKQEFDRISLALSVARTELRKRDEKEFSSALKGAMKNAESDSDPVRQKRFSWPLLLIPLAASLALILAIHFFQDSDQRLYRSYYHPESDPFIQALSDKTRGGEDGTGLSPLDNPGLTYEESAQLIRQGKAGPDIMLLQMISALELGREEAALEISVSGKPTSEDFNLQALAWYRALAFLKMHRSEDAIKELRPLLQHGGPYSRDAHKLHTLLIK